MIEGSCHCGAVRWTFDGPLESATACNCTICRRYGVYGPMATRATRSRSPARPRSIHQGVAHIGFHFCPNCGCVASGARHRTGEDGRRNIAVNLRLAEDPNAVAELPIDHFDGLDKFEDLPRDGRRVKDVGL